MSWVGGVVRVNSRWLWEIYAVAYVTAHSGCSCLLLILLLLLFLYCQRAGTVVWTNQGKALHFNWGSIMYCGTQTHQSTHTHTHTYIDIWILTYIYVYIYRCAFNRVTETANSLYKPTHTYVGMYSSLMQIHVCIYVCVCVCTPHKSLICALYLIVAGFVGW